MKYTKDLDTRYVRKFRGQCRLQQNKRSFTKFSVSYTNDNLQLCLLCENNEIIKLEISKVLIIFLVRGVAPGAVR